MTSHSPGFLQSQGRPLLLGHRGDSSAYPENTLLAFRQAIAAGADGVELDVMPCGSGEVVVVHDDDLGRVIGQQPGSGPAVRDLPLSELRAYDLGAGQRLPMLEEVLEELGPHALINIELKSPDVKTVQAHARLVKNDGLAKSVAQILRRAGRPSGTTLVSSFDPFQLWRFAKASSGHIPLGFLFHRSQIRPLREAWLARLLPIAAVHPDAALVDAVSMRSWRRRGYAVHVWTVDDLNEVAALCTLGVDAIITNTPAAVRMQLDRVKTPSSPRGDTRASS